MATPRLAGGSVVTSTSSIWIRPLLTGSSPAIMRSSVDFPHPEGPTNTTNSPSAIERSTLRMTAAAPNALVTPVSRICAIGRSASQAFGHDVALAGAIELIEEHALGAPQDQFRLGNDQGEIHPHQYRLDMPRG